MMKQSFLAFVLCVASLSLTAQNIYNVISFNAKADGKTINTQAIQQAIDKCTSSGGGTVYFPAGVFLSGTLTLKSNVTIQLDNGAVLKGSSNVADYPENMGLLYGRDVINVSIIGEGEINGNGSAFMNWGKLHTFIDFDKENTRQGQAFLSDVQGHGEGPVGYTKRPGMMIVIMHGERIRIKGVKLVDSPHWTTRFGGCDDVVVEGVTIDNHPLIPNNDGLHFTTSRNIRVSNCYIVAGDDALVMTGFGDETDAIGRKVAIEKTKYTYGNKADVAENIVVNNCILSSRSAAIRIGYGDYPMRNGYFTNIIIRDSNRGVGLFARDKGGIENFTFSNFTIDCRFVQGTWWGRGEPIHVSAITQVNDLTVGKIQNINFQNFEIQAETGVVVYGTKESIIEDITFENVDLKIVNGKFSKGYGGNIDLRPTAEFKTNLFKRDIAGIYCNNVKNLSAKNISLTWEHQLENYFSHGFEIENFQNVLIDGFKGRQNNGAAIHLHDGEKATVRNSEALEGTTVFLKVDHVTKQGFFSGNHLRNAQTPYAPAKLEFTMNNNILK